jgi:hypothetical protein
MSATVAAQGGDEIAMFRADGDCSQVKLAVSLFRKTVQ